MKKTLNIAHRGAVRQAPENTMAAFSKALEIGVDGLEFDVQLSRDGIPVVIHDEMLERTTGSAGLVKDYTLSELQSLDAGGWFDPQFKGASIPTLEEVLDQFKGSKLLFNIELKSGIILYPGLEEAVLKMIADRKLEERTVVSSFNHYSLVTCRQLNPHIRTGLLYVAGLYEPWHYARTLGCYSVHPLFYNLQMPDLVRGFKEHNLPIFTWTVNEEKYMKMMVMAEIEAIITDVPELLKDVLAGEMA